MSHLFQTVRQLYLYAVCGIALIVMIVSSIGLVNLVLEEYVFDVKGWDEINKDYWECTEEQLEFSDFDSLEDCKAHQDEVSGLERANNQKRDLANYISALIVALPLYLYHWKVVRKEKK
jgi:hypothetical protein